MKVLVTGASGFLGAQVTRILLAAGCEVAAVVRPEASLRRLQDVIGRVTLFEGDLYDIDTIRPSLTQWQPETCIHLAWYAEPGQYLHSPQNLAALTASFALLEALSQVGCQQVVATGTCAEYESCLGWLHEDGPTNPQTLYAATKLSLCLVGAQIAAAAGMNFAWARIFYPYGPQEDPRRAVPALIRALLKGHPFPASEGRQVRDYLHVEDIAAALWTLVQERATGIYNIASGEPVTMRGLMETIGEIAGHGELIQFGAVPYRDWDPPFICGDNRRLCALGWAPRYSLKTGLAQTVAWWRAQMDISDRVDGSK